MNRAERFYQSAYEWCLEQSGQGRARPRVIGVNGPQGGGKSTLTAVLCKMLRQEGLKAATVSIDDFYLTRAEQIRLAAENAGNPYLQVRGYPGTHDVALGAQVLNDLRGPSGTVLIPRYEKSLFSGKGDRLPRGAWQEVDLPLDFVFLEGWLVAFHAVGASAVHDPALLEINEKLRPYESWWQTLDALIQLKPLDPGYAIDWRVEAEQRMKASGKSGMSDEEARAYIALFMPAYELYLPTVSLPESRPKWVVEIGMDRLPSQTR